LALLDAQGVQDSDYVNLPRDFNRAAGANSILKHRNEAEHKWCYLHEHQPNEAWIFKYFDRMALHGNVHTSLLVFLELRIFLLGKASSFES
jgi:hypothetical protein